MLPKIKSHRRIKILIDGISDVTKAISVVFPCYLLRMAKREDLKKTCDATVKVAEGHAFKWNFCEQTF